MSRTNGARWGLTLVALAALTAYSARAQQQGVGERIGEKLDEAGSAVRRGAERAGDAVKEQFGRAKASVNALGIEGRVYGRLHWDKALEKASIDVSAAKDGTVTLTGTVADSAARAKALVLTGDTVGVARVVDQLTTPAGTPTP